jgi:polyisoprenoid-binding protein YceI
MKKHQTQLLINMKKTIITSLLIIGFSFGLKAQSKRAIDLNKSKVHWFGSHAFDFSGHEGIVIIKDGELLTTNDRITSGSFVIDMNTLINTDGDLNQDLIDHLKGEDFFEVKKYPTAKFMINNIKYHDPKNTPESKQIYIRVHGNLTIKGVTQSVWFEGEMNPEQTLILSKFKIDRTVYGINYKSKSFGASVKDGIISDAIELRIELHLK